MEKRLLCGEEVSPEFATSSHNNIKLFLYFSRFSLIFLCPYDIMCM